MTRHLFKGGRSQWVPGALILFASFVAGMVSQAASTNGPLIMADFIREYQADQNSVSRFYDLKWSEARFERLDRHYNEWRQKLKALDFDALDEQGRIDYLLLRNKLTSEGADLRLDREWLGQMKELLPFRQPLLDLEMERRRMV